MENEEDVSGDEDNDTNGEDDEDGVESDEQDDDDDDDDTDVKIEDNNLADMEELEKEYNDLRHEEQ